MVRCTLSRTDVSDDAPAHRRSSRRAQAFYWTGHNPTALAGNLAHTRVFVRVGDGLPDPATASEVQNTFGQVAEAEPRQHARDFAAATRAVGAGAGAPTVYEERQGVHAWRY
jgi:S-formylglutathione hydrolase FrmB